MAFLDDIGQAFGAVGTGLQIGGVLGATMGAYRKSTADKAAYQYQSKVAANNATLAEYQAQNAITRGQATDANIGQRTKTLASNQAADFSARGIDIGSGSPLDILSSTAFMGARDVATNDQNTSNEAWSLRQQAANFTSNSQALQGRADMESPLGSAAGTLLTGAGTVAASWYKQNKGLYNPYTDD